LSISAPLLGRGSDEHPLSVLDQCRISWGTVLSTNGVTALILSQHLCWNRSVLLLSPPEARRVETLTEAGRGFAVTPGDLVAVHWGRVCDRLTPEQVARLKDSTDRQLHVTNRRLSVKPS
jgi:hypothetical protein